jgi:mannose-1-phosphate guanylyltransferase
MSCAAEEWSTYRDAGHNWALVLAAGDGSRLHALTTTACGIAVPKQFCSLGGGSSLLQDALRRASVVAPPERTCAVVAAQHHRWWKGLSASIPAQNIVVQPRNCGTANGILLPLLRILHRDPDASLLVLPSDHYVRNETVLATGLKLAAQAAGQCDAIVLVGFAPEAPDPDLGYIVPAGEHDPGVREVREFIEKPSESAARQLIERGGLWNSFIFAARGETLLRIFEQRCPEIVMEMRGILAKGSPGAMPDPYLIELYDRLPPMDFSRDIMERCTSRLQVVRVPPCGWSDLGTPRRVAETLVSNRPVFHAQMLQPVAAGGGFLSLAAQYAKLLAMQNPVEIAGEAR